MFSAPQAFRTPEPKRRILKDPPSPPAAGLTESCYEVIDANSFREGVLRITISRGQAPRQHGIPANSKPTVVIAPHPIPEERRKKAQAAFQAITSSFRVPALHKLAQHKTTNRLLYTLAFEEAANLSADEAILMNTEGNLTEGSSSNLFWVEDKTVCTTPASGALAEIPVRHIAYKFNISPTSPPFLIAASAANRRTLRKLPKPSRQSNPYQGKS